MALIRQIKKVRIVFRIYFVPLYVFSFQVYFKPQETSITAAQILRTIQQKSADHEYIPESGRYIAFILQIVHKNDRDLVIDFLDKDRMSSSPESRKRNSIELKM
jgi:hypothetical protein